MPESVLQEDDLVRAGELALGVLDGDERAAALRRVLAEPDFATEVEAWHGRLAPLLESYVEVDAPPSAWHGIRSAIGSTAPTGSVARWRAATAILGAIAACLAVVLVWRDTTLPTPLPRPAQTLLAQLSDKDGKPLLVASYDSAAGMLRVRTNNLPLGERRPELWVIGSDATPRSLGLVALNGASEFAAPAGLRGQLIADSTFALTLEPSAGAPHAAPTGEILATAKLARL